VSSGAGFYVAGTIVLAILTAGMLYWRFRQPAAQPPVPAPLATVAPAEKEVAPLHALPPPPKLDEGSPAAQGTAAAASSGAKAADQGPAGAASGGSGALAGASGAAGASAKGVCSACGEGQVSAALKAAMESAAQSAQGCYKRALRTTAVSGSITLSVQVGSNGTVCNASVTKDTVGSGEITSCVVGKFQGRSFPAPQSGCVVVNIPIRFELKQ
jgi:hypothetical protein